MPDLSTTYLGLNLDSPLVPSASPLSKNLDNIRRMEDAGAAAVVLYSLFEEQITAESLELDFFLTHGTESYAEALTYFPEPAEFNLGPDQYVEHVRRAKEAVDIPIIGSLNGVSTGGWIRRRHEGRWIEYARKIEQAGADALELNIYYVPTDPDLSGETIEEMYLNLARDVKQSVRLPVAVKLSPFFTNTAAMAHRFDQMGVDALVLFNRFYQPDFDLETLDVVPRVSLSASSDLRVPLRWIAILYGRIRTDLALTTGVHTAEDAIKGVLAGAKVTMLAAELLTNGIVRLGEIRAEMVRWMEEHEYESVEQMRGSMSQQSIAFPAAFERAHYMRALNTWRPPTPLCEVVGISAGQPAERPGNHTMPPEDPRILELRALRERAQSGGGADRIARQRAKGKLTARERLGLLLDPGTFNELEPFATPQGGETDLAAEKYLGDGVLTGYGQVDGRTLYVYAQDFTIHGGTLSEMQSHKICRVMDLAARNGVPVVGLIDSGGARIQEGVKSLAGYAEIFRRNTRYSGVIPQISVMMGPCAGGAAYTPALTDLILMVERQSYMFLTGPDVIQAVTGETIDVESLGGAEVHMSVSGTAHLSAASEPAVLALCRRVLGYLPANNVENPPFAPSADDPRRMDDDLNSLVPLDSATAYSMHEVIARVVDRDSFLELQPGWARNAVVGLARLGGHSAGLVAQEPGVMAGVIDIDASDKIARFVRLCDCFNLPLVTFVDSPGFLPGADQEYRGIIRHGAKVVYAYSEATVPKICLITRKAYGGAYIVMSSKCLGTDINYAWPSAEIAVMGAEGAANILYRAQIQSAADPAVERARLAEDYRRRFNNPYLAAGAGFVDDVIEPRETRPKLIAALGALRDKYSAAPSRKHGNIPV